jgi:hypothetical protein
MRLRRVMPLGFSPVFSRSDQAYPPPAEPVRGAGALAVTGRLDLFKDPKEEARYLLRSRTVHGAVVNLAL